MSDFPIQRFIQISKFDQSLMQSQRQIELLQQDVQQLEQQISVLKESLEKQKNSKLQLQKKVDQKELEMKALVQQENEKKRKLDMAQSVRETQSLFLEVEALKKEEYALEEDLLQAWHSFEIAKKQFEQAQSQYQEQSQYHVDAIEKKESDIQAIQRQIEDQKKEKEVLARDLPEEWLEKYAAMQSRVANPVVCVVNGQCSACFYTISVQDLARLNNRALIQCKDCYRFLYIESAL